MIRGDAIPFPGWRFIVLLLCAIGLSACANRPQPLYYWGEYQPQVYSYFKGEQGVEEQIIALEKDIEEAKASNLRLPPGFYAHLALLNGKVGRADKMKQYLETEKSLYPESTPFMDFSLKHFSQKAAS